MNGDCLRGLLELMEFWISMGKPDDCPMIFPDRADKESVQSYFTKEAYELQVMKNRGWLEEEISGILRPFRFYPIRPFKGGAYETQHAQPSAKCL